VTKQFESWNLVLDKLSTYAPSFAQRFGSLAKAYQYRYLARRCVFQGQASAALKLLFNAFKTNPQAFMDEKKKTLETLGASLLLSVLPRATQLKIIRKLLKR
jgi:hypothetical protein